MLRLILIIFVLTSPAPSFAAEVTNRFACDEILLPADVPVHKLKVTLSGDDVKILRIKDTFDGEERLVYKMRYRIKKDRPKIISIKSGFIYKRIENEALPESKLVSLDLTTDLIYRLNEMPWMRERFGKAVGGAVTDGHLSHLVWTTADGRWHRQEIMPHKVLLIDKATLKIKLILDVQPSAEARARLSALVDYSGIIDWYASSLERPRPTDKELREYNETVALELRRP